MNHYLKSAISAVTFTKQTILTMEQCYRAQCLTRSADQKSLDRAQSLLGQQKEMLVAEETIVANLRAIQ
jgi:hypothetical protein